MSNSSFGPELEQIKAYLKSKDNEDAKRLYFTPSFKSYLRKSLKLKVMLMVPIFMLKGK